MIGTVLAILAAWLALGLAAAALWGAFVKAGRGS